MVKWRVIVNRAAGRSATSVDAVRSALSAGGVDAVVEAPRTSEEARAMIRSAAIEGSTHIAVAGGDGTLNLAANTLLEMEGLEPPVVALLPIGSGCDILRTFGIPQDLVGAARHLTTEDTYPIDVATLEGSWGTRYFVNVAQVGVGAAAAVTALRVGRRFGSARYPMAFAARLPRFPRAVVSVETEKRRYESEALALILANAQFFAGGWNIAPKATLVDGVLDMQLINCAKQRAPALVSKIIGGNHLTDRAVRRFSAATYQVTTDIPWPLEADGDYIGNTPVSGRVLRAALRLKI
ncbi:MAG TPA: diacylglycerol kinase family protein [Acidimicrobiia bacterium]|nr:diacylglycerol kinase family protein [Acidimicrobiia bacterium]